MGGTIVLLVRLAISMAVVMGVVGLAARFVRRRQGMGGSSLWGNGSARVARPSGPSAGSGTGSMGAGFGTGGSGQGGRAGWGNLAKRGQKARKPRPEAPFEVVYRRSLAKGANITLVQAGGRQYLLGVTEQSVNLLTEVAPVGTSGLPASAGAGGAAAVTLTPMGNGTADMPDRLDDIDDWQRTGRMPVSLAEAATPGQPTTAWKLAIDSLRERTVRR